MCKRIPLSHGKFALVSDADYESIARFKWSCDRNGYACRMIQVARIDGKRKRRKIMLHRFLLDAPTGMEVDHINGDPLDNRRENIRVASRSQNRQNARPRKSGSSRYKGVWLHRRDNVWRSEIVIDGKRYGLGSFATEQNAAIAYNQAALAAWGDYAYLNPVSNLHVP